MADSVVILDAKQWRSFIGKALRDLSNPIPRLKVAANIWGFKNIIEHFRNEEGSEGKWEERKSSTQKLYARLHKTDRKYNPSNKLLQLSGHLRQTLLRGKGDIKTVGRSGILLSSRAPYSGKHDRGEDGMTKRDFMWLSGETQQKMVDYLLTIFG